MEAEVYKYSLQVRHIRICDTHFWGMHFMLWRGGHLNVYVVQGQSPEEFCNFFLLVFNFSLIKPNNKYRKLTKYFWQDTESISINFESTNILNWICLIIMPIFHFSEMPTLTSRKYGGLKQKIWRFSKLHATSMAQSLPEIRRLPDLGVKMDKNVYKNREPPY